MISFVLGNGNIPYFTLTCRNNWVHIFVDSHLLINMLLKKCFKDCFCQIIKYQFDGLFFITSTYNVRVKLYGDKWLNPSGRTPLEKFLLEIIQIV